MEEEILYTIDDQHIARLTLNRPHVHNAFNNEMVEKLTECFKELQDTPSVRALVIQGNGKSFCAGADLSWIEQSFQKSSADSFKNARNLSQMLYVLNNVSIPTLTYLHGSVMGGGVGIAACSDIVLSDSKTILSFPETNLGIAPAIISPYILRAIGPRYVRRYFLTGESFTAKDAHHMGLVHQIIESDNRDAEIETVISNILEGGPHAVIKTKQLIGKLTGEIDEKTRLMTIELIDSLCHSEEAQQRVAAFLKNKTSLRESQADQL
ncbi:MAG TPA: enoyl-CoA hydratase-related protein [Alphaproteobacteria bacterium]|nr:enoyl-CoA hydratase-related protein [Alphaproteobacteria bacterium]